MNLGKRKFIQYVMRRKKSDIYWTQKDLSVELGCTAGYVSLLLNSRTHKPGKKMAKKIEELTQKIKASDWSKQYIPKEKKNDVA